MKSVRMMTPKERLALYRQKVEKQRESLAVLLAAVRASAGEADLDWIEKTAVHAAKYGTIGSSHARELRREIAASRRRFRKSQQAR